MTVFDIILWLCVAILVLMVIGGLFMLAFFLIAAVSGLREARAEFNKSLDGTTKKEA